MTKNEMIKYLKEKGLKHGDKVFFFSDNNKEKRMTIKYHCHSINEVTHVETKEIWHELSHWYTSSKCPQTAGKRIAGYFKTREDAENHHNNMLVKGLLGEESA